MSNARKCPKCDLQGVTTPTCPRCKFNIAAREAAIENTRARDAVSVPGRPVFSDPTAARPHDDQGAAELVTADAVHNLADAIRHLAFAVRDAVALAISTLPKPPEATTPAPTDAAPARTAESP